MCLLWLNFRIDRSGTAMSPVPYPGFRLRSIRATLADENPDFKSQDVPGVLQMLIQLYESNGTPQQAIPYRDRLSMIESN